MKSGKATENWHGKISKVISHGTCYEIFIVSRSSIMVMLGKSSRGLFVCMPDYGISCHLVDLKNKFWNIEKLKEVLGKVDGTTVATALFRLHKDKLI
jgi:hypothetical protein